VEYAEFELNKPQPDGQASGFVPQGYVFCNYRKKNQLVYFLLELLLNIGAGHFYVGNYLMGGLKIGLIFMPCVVLCLLLCLGVVTTNKHELLAGCGMCLVCLLACGISVWWLVDVILIGIRKYTDGNGVPLNPM